MKILGISSGTKNGNNDSMCKEALLAAKGKGAEVEFVRLLDLDLKYCTGCVTCSISLVTGQGNRCILKDDFDWLLDKMLDADGIIFTTPIYEKGAPAIFRTLTDRFGPRTDRGMNVIGNHIAEHEGGKPIDPRFLQDKVVSYIGIGGSDWSTRIQCDHGMHALSPGWKIIDNEVFPWSKTIIMEDDKVARIREIGLNLADAAKDIQAATYQGESGICPHCHSREFYLNDSATAAICCLCGIEGELKVDGGKVTFNFPQEVVALAHDTLSGKLKHAEEIRENEGQNMAHRKTDAYKERVAFYRDQIAPTLPNK